MLDINIIDLETDELIDEAYSNGFIDRSVLHHSIDTGNFVMLRCGDKSVILASKGVFLNVVKPNIKLGNAVAKDKEQTCFIHALKHYSLVICVGNPGSGKTFLSMNHAVNRVYKGGMKLVLTKPLTQVTKSNAIGTTPGDVKDKILPYLGSFMTALKDVMGADNFEDKLERLESQGLLSFYPIELMRGESFKNSLVVCDEVQNLDFHSLLTLMSRCGEGCQLLLLGDLNQIDNPKMKMQDTGIAKLLNSNTWFDNSDMGIAIKLTNCYRSGIARLAIDFQSEMAGN